MKERSAADILENVDRELAERKDKRWRDRLGRANPPHILSEPQRRARRVKNAARAKARLLHRSRRRHGRPLGR